MSRRRAATALLVSCATFAACSPPAPQSASDAEAVAAPGGAGQDTLTAVDPDTLKALDPDTLKALDPDTLKALDLETLKALDPDTLTALDLETLKALDTLTAPALAAMLARGEVTATTVTRAYLDRIEALDENGPALNAVIEINPDALDIAAELDAHLAAGGEPGTLHGVPVLLKANIDTGDGMITSAGSLALAEHRAPADAFHVARLRAAGAVILGKTNLSEWANFRDENATSGWSSLGGQTRNPHVLDRNPCGSSSGSAVAVAASLAPLAIGTETNGSIVCPAGVNGIVGIKPTLGLVSRSGIIPIAHSQDTAGPMAKTVAGAALLLSVMVGRDPADPATAGLPDGFAELLPDPGATRLDGERIGILRTYFGAGEFPQIEQIYESGVRTLAELGAELVDPVNFSREAEQRDAAYEVLLYEFKAGLNAYLEKASAPQNVDTLAELIIWNDSHANATMPWFGQSIFVEAEARGDLTTSGYTDALELNNARMTRDLTALFDTNGLDALFVPINGPAWKTDWIGGDRYTFGGTASLGAITGFPSITLPAGDIAGLPIGVGFVGRPFADAEIIRLAHAFEQATRARIAPRYLPTLERDAALPQRAVNAPVPAAGPP